VKLGNPRLLAGSPDQARMAAAAKSTKATARATDLLPVIAEVRAAGVATLSGIAKALTARGVQTPSGPRRLESGNGEIAGCRPPEHPQRRNLTKGPTGKCWR
jgi:hypothetical protein